MGVDVLGGRHSLGLFTWFAYARTYCVPIATLNLKKRTRLLYLGDTQIINNLPLSRQFALTAVKLQMFGGKTWHVWHPIRTRFFFVSCPRSDETNGSITNGIHLNLSKAP